MEILDNKSIISQTVPRLIETPDHLIINTQVYDKASFKPVPFEFNVIDATAFCSLNRCIWTFDNSAGRDMFLHTGNAKNQKMYQDSSNANIFYSLAKYPSYGTKFMKFKKEENNISEQYSASWNTNSTSSSCGSTINYGNDMHILFQNDLYFLLVLKLNYNANAWTSGGARYLVRKFDKKANTFVDLTDFKNGEGQAPIWNAQFMENHDDNVYYYRQTGGNSYGIGRVNLSANTIEILTEFTTTGGLAVIDNPVKIGEYYYVIKDNYQQSGLHEYCFHKIKLDTVANTATCDIINIDLNGFVLDTAPGEVLSGIGEGVYHTLKTLEINNKKYIICTIHSTPNQNYYPNQHKNIVFEVTDDKIIVKDVITFSNGCKGVLEYIDTNTLVFLFTDSIAFYKFDDTKEKYILTYRKSGIYNTIGFDTLNRFYMQHSTNAIEVMTSMNACVLNADFAEEYYTNINVDTEISYYAKNFLNEYLSTDVKITLIGPVEFKDDKSKTKITKTSINGLKTLPVTITGSGRIEVIITQLT